MAQRFSTTFGPRAWSWKPGIESQVRLPAWSLLLPLPLSLMNKIIFKKIFLKSCLIKSIRKDKMYKGTIWINNTLVNKFKRLVFLGAPGWLSRLSGCLQLRSWSQNPGIEPHAPAYREPASPSPPWPCALLHALFLSLSQINKIIHTVILDQGKKT